MKAACGLAFLPPIPIRPDRAARLRPEFWGQKKAARAAVYPGPVTGRPPRGREVLLVLAFFGNPFRRRRLLLAQPVISLRRN